MGIRTSDLPLELLSRDLDRRSREDRRSRLSRSCSRSAVSDRGPPFISSFTPLQQQQHAQHRTTFKAGHKVPSSHTQSVRLRQRSSCSALSDRMLLLMSPFNPFAAACQAQDSAKVILQTALMEGAPSTGSPVRRVVSNMQPAFHRHLQTPT